MAGALASFVVFGASRDLSRSDIDHRAGLVWAALPDTTVRVVPSSTALTTRHRFAPWATSPTPLLTIGQRPWSLVVGTSQGDASLLAPVRAPNGRLDGGHRPREHLGPNPTPPRRLSSTARRGPSPRRRPTPHPPTRRRSALSRRPRRAAAEPASPGGDPRAYERTEASHVLLAELGAVAVGDLEAVDHQAVLGRHLG